MIFGVKEYALKLEKIALDRGVELNPYNNLIKVDKNKHIATFKNVQNNNIIEYPYNLLHVVPKHNPPSFIANSNLADKDGYVDVNKYSLQHVRYKNIFSIGDSNNCPTSKTASGVFNQFPIVS